MEPTLESPQKHYMNRVTPFSKGLALVLFVSLPVLALYIGFQKGKNVPSIEGTETMESVKGETTKLDVLAAELVKGQEYGDFRFVNEFSYDGYSRFMFNGGTTVSGRLFGYGLNGIGMQVAESDQEKLPQIFKDRLTAISFLENELMRKAYDKAGSEGVVQIQIHNVSFRIDESNQRQLGTSDPVEVIADNLLVLEPIEE